MLYNYVDTGLDDNLICCICRAPFNEPVTTRTCFHTFCQECILQALSVSNHCPIDRSPLSAELLGQADPIVRHLVDELVVRCPHLDAGCEYTGERHLLGSHLKLQCPYAQVPCPCSEKGCKRRVARKDALEGDAIVHQGVEVESESSQTVTCESCEKEFSHVSIMKDHLESSCPGRVVPCNQAENGCTWKGRRVSLKVHIDNCPYESIKGFFDLHNAKMSQLSKDNERLRRRSDELEGVVRILRQELEWAKIALGPWYRPVYPERPPVTTNYDQYPDEGICTGPGPSRVGPTLLGGMHPTTGGTFHPEPRVENVGAETFDLSDPFPFISQMQSHIPNIYATNNASPTTIVASTESSSNLSTYTSSHAVESGDNHDLGEDAISGNGSSGSGSSNGLGSIQNATGFVLSRETSNLQPTSATPPTAHFSDHFPSENQVVFEEHGSPSQPQGWEYTPSPNSMSSNPGLSIHSPNQPPISASMHSRSVPCNRPQFTTSLNKHIVAPLNLSTTVEGSLVGLRESLVTLSEALESQGRGLELALTTEGLRASEEVGSLKAIVQGLRMQVHAIMMDRNALVTGRIGGILNVPSYLSARPQQYPGPGGAVGGEDPNQDPALRLPEEDGFSSPGGPRFMEGHHAGGGLLGFLPQQPAGVGVPVMGPNYPIGPPPHPGARFHINQGRVAGGGVLPLGGMSMGPLSPHHLYMSPTAGSGPKL